MQATYLELQGQSEQFVQQRWTAIKALAITLLAKSWEPLKPLERGGTRAGTDPADRPGKEDENRYKL